MLLDHHEWYIIMPSSSSLHFVITTFFAITILIIAIIIIIIKAINNTVAYTVWAALNIAILRAEEVEARLVWSRAGIQGRGKRESPENTRQPAALPARFLRFDATSADIVKDTAKQVAQRTKGSKPVMEESALGRSSASEDDVQESASERSGTIMHTAYKCMASLNTLFFTVFVHVVSTSHPLALRYMERHSLPWNLTDAGCCSAADGPRIAGLYVPNPGYCSTVVAGFLIGATHDLLVTYQAKVQAIVLFGHEEGSSGLPVPCAVGRYHAGASLLESQPDMKAEKVLIMKQRPSLNTAPRQYMAFQIALAWHNCKQSRCCCRVNGRWYRKFASARSRETVRTHTGAPTLASIAKQVAMGYPGAGRTIRHTSRVVVSLVYPEPVARVLVPSCIHCSQRIGPYTEKKISEFLRAYEAEARSPSKPADQWHRPARFPHVKIWKRPRRDSSPFQTVFGPHGGLHGDMTTLRFSARDYNLSRKVRQLRTATSSVSSRRSSPYCALASYRLVILALMRPRSHARVYDHIRTLHPEQKELHRNWLHMCESLSSALKYMFRMPSISTNTYINPSLNGHPDAWIHASLTSRKVGIGPARRTTDTEDFLIRQRAVAGQGTTYRDILQSVVPVLRTASTAPFAFDPSASCGTPSMLPGTQQWPEEWQHSVAPFPTNVCSIPNAIMKQDIARSYAARITQKALQYVDTIPWPARSPDFSTIQYVLLHPTCYFLDEEVSEFNIECYCIKYCECRLESYLNERTGGVALRRMFEVSSILIDSACNCHRITREATLGNDMGSHVIQWTTCKVNLLCKGNQMGVTVVENWCPDVLEIEGGMRTMARNELLRSTPNAFMLTQGILLIGLRTRLGLWLPVAVCFSLDISLTNTLRRVSMLSCGGGEGWFRPISRSTLGGVATPGCRYSAMERYNDSIRAYPKLGYTK
ncbi:hypothetical protein PR048_015681 [Dryococelus australis]|uniref:Uncharacterized protein n=1 Tax=Dryococelus australis TaxID=614101 RepID=A0ABQ9HHL7_9NEOP|nr:hypothetical protein PR048_015681 [Dryococelus australis]